MKRLEYVLSLMLALLVLAGAVAWTQASSSGHATAVSCQARQELNPGVSQGHEHLSLPQGKASLNWKLTTGN